MKFIRSFVGKIDSAQRGSRSAGFTVAVIKKYGDDKVGYQAALLTYYGFLALFPLLLVLTTVAGMIADNHPDIQADIIRSMTNYFPVLGNQLAEHVSTIHRTGLALVFGILFTLYGARGVADVFHRGVKHVFHEPLTASDDFPKSLLKSFSVMFVGGLGLLLASVLAGLVTAVGHDLGFRLLSLLVNLFVLFWLYIFLLKMTLHKHVAIRKVYVGAIVASLGLILLQGVGGYVITRELKSLDALYSYFAIALGLLFWIYLQAQVLYYAVTAAAVQSQQLWPRSLTGKNPTAADQRAKNTSQNSDDTILG